VTEAGVVRRDFGSGAERVLSSVGTGVVLDETGDIAVVSCADGSIRVCSTLGGEPHLLLGHRYGSLTGTSVSPDGRWIASGDVDGSIRLWPMPDLTRPPLHTLPREELIAKLETLTNLRAIRDPDSPTGWKVEIDPFPGWETVPSW
jgi:WD40 repeat protein